MKVIPVINCQEFDAVKSRVQIATGDLFPMLAPEDRWLHIDIADGGFTKGYSTWRNPGDLAQLKLPADIKIELHLMVNEPEVAMEGWLAAGISRLIFHLETTSVLETVMEACHSRGVEPMLALKPETPVAHARPYLASLHSCQLLAVTPGPAGQPLQPQILEKIKAIRAQFPDMLIEVDGGVTLETAGQMKAAGASQIVAGSSIFDASDPAAVFRQYLEL